MTQKIEHFLDNLQGQNLLSKLLIPSLVLFALVLFVIFFKNGFVSPVIVVATIIAFYMALNIWANDVANNVWPTVGSKALTLWGAVILAMIFEWAGAIIAGWDVVQTIKGSIIDTSTISDPKVFIGIMLATLLGWAIWINVATATRSPVSVTHSSIWALLWAGVMALWLAGVHWGVIGNIILSWIVSPLMWGGIAAFFMWSIDTTILHKKNRHDAALLWVPFFIAVMAWAFSTYLMMKGLKQVIHVSFLTSFLTGLFLAVCVFFGLKKYLSRHESYFKNSKKSINTLFNIPLIFAAALLSFAHGANDTANAVGPFMAIYETVQAGSIVSEIGIEVWIMLVGVIGLAVGLSVYGATLIKTVGNEITKLNQIRAYCVALAAAITVILASLLGLPVSSTHIAIGGIFGIWFYREIRKKLKGWEKEYIDKSILKQILLAWGITLPASAAIAGLCYTSIIYFL